jgi:diguanylate cyclase (GGDEF)-like protein/PAS domain S-box-containing protein
VITAWGQVRETGATRTRVHVTGSETEATLYMFDMREAHGVLAAVLVTDDAVVPPAVAEDMPYLARFAVQRKNDTAVFLEVDDATTSMLGWSRDDMVGHGSLEFVHADDRASAVESWVDMLASPGCTRRVRLRYLHSDGHAVWLELTNHNHLDDPAIGSVVTECLDVSDEMAAHEVVREREQLLRRIAETVPLGLMQVDPNGHVRYANERLYEILDSREAPDDPLARVASDDRDAFASALDALVADGVDRDIHVVVPFRPGRDARVCEVGIRALTDDNGGVAGALVCVDDVTARLRDRAELEMRATYDDLTGCRNRASILEQLHVLDGATRAGVVFVDLDDFKRVNDQHGHAVGDAVLVETSARLRDCVRDHDSVGRLGGDEFLLVCPRATSLDDLAKIAERVDHAVRQPFAVPNGIVTITASVGIAVRQPGDTVSALVARADTAMYAAKRST